MKRVVILYASHTGSTRHYAFWARDLLAQDALFYEVSLLEVHAFAAKRLQEYDVWLVGCSTWSQGDVHRHFVPFLREVRSYSFPEKRFAIFGLGSARYLEFCEAVNIIESRLLSTQAEALVSSLRLDIQDPQKDQHFLTWLQKVRSQIT